MKAAAVASGRVCDGVQVAIWFGAFELGWKMTRVVARHCRPTVARRSQVVRVDVRHPASPLSDLFVHVFGSAWTIAAAAVPQADEPGLVDAPCQRRVEQPQIAALEWIDARR